MFGRVASPAAIWGSWISTGPLIIFVIVTIDIKSNLNRTDWILMGSFLVCLVAGFCIILAQTIAIGIFLLFLSLTAFLPVLYLPFHTISSRNVYCESDSERMFQFGEEGDIRGIDLTDLKKKRFELSMIMMALFPMFPLVYILAWSRAIEPAVAITGFQVLNLVTKGLFASAATSGHFDVLVAVRRQWKEIAERVERSNEARRLLLKYLFHEIRNPLNSMAIGMEVLAASSHLDESELESLNMMREASAAMTTTLDDVLTLQRIEEG